MSRRLGVMAFAVLSVAFLAWQSFGQAGAANKPAVQAAFAGDNKLMVAVDFPGEKAGDVTVSISEDGKQIATATKTLARNTAVLELPVAAKDRDRFSITVAFGGDKSTSPLHEVLLAKAQETTLLAGQDYFAGSPAALQVNVAAVKSIMESKAIEGAEVTVELVDETNKKTYPLGSGKTTAKGGASVKFEVPELNAGRYTLNVVTKTRLGEEKLSHIINVKTDSKILLVSDKPIYQPGQKMHVRALVLQAFNMKPVANKDINFEIEDNKGNKVFKKSFKTSDFGVASVDFQLADEVNMGDYQIRANVGSLQAGKTVQVKRYTLPKFKTTVTTDKTFYLPKETIKVDLQSDYFFGKPVAKAKVDVEASTFDVAFKSFHKFSGVTDENGHLKFEVTLPDYFVGLPLQKGNAIVKLDVKLVDTAESRQEIAKTLSVSDQPIKVSLIPGSGKLAPGLTNRVFVAAIYPDGSPAPNSTVDIWQGKEAKGEPIASVKTNAAGLAEFTLKPDAKNFRGNGQNELLNREMLGGVVQQWANKMVLDMRVQAQDKQGNKAAVDVELNAQPFGDNVLVRLDKAVYQPGDRMTVDVRTSAGLPTAYVDIVRGGQIMLSQWAEVKDGQAQVSIDMPPTVFGSLEVHGYQMLTNGEILRDSRVVYVQPKNDLKIDVKNTKTEFAPGEESRLRFIVTDSAGNPTQAALGVIVVDEAVYALSEMQPGLEKVYFTLQEELLKPQVQINFSPGERIDNIILQPAVAAPQQQIAEVLLGAVKLPPPARWNVDPGQGRKQQAQAIAFQVGNAIYGYAFSNAFLADVKPGQPAEFKKGLLDDMLKSGHIHPNLLKGPFGETITLGEMQKLEPGFTADKMAFTITSQRMQQLTQTVNGLALANKEKYQKDGKWVLDEDLLALAVKQSGLAGKDAWGHGLKLTLAKEEPAPKEAPKDPKAQGDVKNDQPVAPKVAAPVAPQIAPQPVGGRPIQPGIAQPVQPVRIALAYEVTSAGPDGKFGTKDDLGHEEIAALNKLGWAGHVWFLGDEQRTALLSQPARHFLYRQQLGKAEEKFRARDFANGNMPMDGRFGGGGGFAGGFGGGAGRGGLPMAPPMARLAPGAAVPLAEAAQNKAALALPAEDRAERDAAKLDQRAGDPAATGAPNGQGAAPITKVREYFPETMLWMPNLITDDKGVADLAVEFADSITTWRLSASANSAGGLLGNANIPLKVFQDFFVDIDLPVALTQTDEIDFPVAVYNYLKTPQSVKLELQQEPWFTLLDGKGLERTIDLKPGEVTAVKYRIKADKIGYQPLLVKAHGTKKSDAVKRVVEVVPNGEKIERTFSDRLGAKVSQTINIPEGAAPDASKLLVRIYPGVMAQVMEGMDSILRLPGGCFEQTSSSAYPNIMAVDYIKKAKLNSPAIMMKAEQYLNAGYQRLLTFERPGGGFDWWGSGEPLVWLSAYGLQEFNDMSRVWPIDRGIITRTQAFLMNKRDKDGTWSNIGATHGETIASMGNAKLLLTSYVVWSLLESDFDKKQLDVSVKYIREHLNDAGENAYILALAANALATYDPKDDSTLECIAKLEKLRTEHAEWKAAMYTAKATTLTYARGDAVTVETTALAALANLKAGTNVNSVNQALTYLVKSKGNGHWGSTQATILALRALIAGMGGAPVKDAQPFTITVNGKEVARGKVDADNSDLLQSFDLAQHLKPGDNQVDLEMKGESALMYQVLARHYMPWKKENVAEKKKVIDVDVTYDRTKLASADLLNAKATLKYTGEVPTFNVILDLGIAPGFTVDAGEFAEMVAAKKVAKFSVTARQVTLYLGDVKPGDTLTFEYSLRAKYPLRVQAPGAVAWEYYTPANRAESRPVEITVTDKK